METSYIRLLLCVLYMRPAPCPYQVFHRIYRKCEFSRFHT